MQRSYAAAFTQGTRQNHLRQTQTYLRFMLKHNFPHLNPSIIHLLLYTQFLANSFKAVATVKNYISGSKSFLTQQGASTDILSSPLLTNLFKGLYRLSDHIPDQAPPLLTSDVKCVCDLLAALDDHARIARVAILIGFATFLRQSNLLPSAVLGGDHCIRREDMVATPTELWITINSSRTISDVRNRVCIPVYAASSRYCPVLAWHQYVQRLPLPPHFPAFMLSPAIPLTSVKLTSYLRGALASMRHPLAGTATVHSLRRSGARAAAAGGAPEPEVMTHGTWTSSAVHAYVPKKLFTKVPHVIAQMFGH